MPSRARLIVLAAAALLIAAVVAPATALATVTVSRADFSGGSLRLEGRAFANRSITVDGVAMTTSDGSGAFKVSRNGFTAPADCTVEVNDGAPTPFGARLNGCTVTSTTPPATSTLAFVSSTGSFDLGGEIGQRVVPLEVGTFANRFFDASGGALPYRWSVTGTLPAGMSFIQDDPAGTLVRIGGTPVAAGTSSVTLRLTDSRGTTVAHVVTVTIGDGTLTGTAGATSVSLSPAGVTGGTSSTATVTIGAPAPAEGAFVSLASDNAQVATVPASVTVPAGATSATFPVSTTAVTLTATSAISASYGGTTRSATLTVNPAATANPDTVSVTRAEYDSAKHQLRVDASSSKAGATLRVYNTSTGAAIGTLSGGGGTFSVAANPQSITVKSSLGGSATRTVIAK